MYQPEGKPGKSPLIFLVHGNHGSCDTGTGPNCTIFKRNDEGYAYLGENLASWGYTVFSLDQDELISRQDGSFGKGMHARRLLMMAALDKLKEASEGAVTETEDSNVAGRLAGNLDMTRIGLMGHSRGGDAVSSFLDYDRSRPVGDRYPIRAVISLAPVDYERHSPIGVPFMSIVGSCDGDVSNLQGARLYERSQYQDGDPYPRYQVVQVGGNHDAYNTVWQADGDDSGQADAACHPAATHAGATGKVTGSKLVDNSYATTPSKSAGVLLTGAETLNEGVSITGSLFTGDVDGVYNADVTNTGVRKGAPVSARGNFWGEGGEPVEGPTLAGPPEQEGISPKDSEGQPSVLYAPVATTAPVVPAVLSALPDVAPVGSIVNPGDGETVAAGATVEPVVQVEDDYGVKSVTMTADGAAIGTVGEAPYTFSWTPSDAEVGKTVKLEATIVDSSGQTTTSTISVPVAATPHADADPTGAPGAAHAAERWWRWRIRWSGTERACRGQEDQAEPA